MNSIKRHAKHKTHRKRGLVIGGLSVVFVLLIGLGIWGYFALHHPQVNPQNPENLHPYFSFQQTQPPAGWVGFMNSSPQGTRTENDKVLPTVAYNIAEGESKDKPKFNGCFIMYSYYTVKADINALFKEYEDNSLWGSDITFEQLPTKELSLHTPEGVKTFQLHHYNYTSRGSPIMQGAELGYIPLNDGYIKINGICSTAAELATTHQALTSVELKP